MQGCFLADVALRHKSRLPPLRIPSSMNNFKGSMDDSKDDDEKMSIANTKEGRQAFVKFPKSLSNDEIRSSSTNMEKSSPMALDAHPSSPQSAREMRMASPSNSHSPVTPTLVMPKSIRSQREQIFSENDRQEALPSITD